MSFMESLTRLTVGAVEAEIKAHDAQIDPDDLPRDHKDAPCRICGERMGDHSAETAFRCQVGE